MGQSRPGIWSLKGLGGGKDRLQVEKAPTYHEGVNFMASIYREFIIEADPNIVWSAIRDVGTIHRRLAKGFVVDTQLEGDVRTVTFKNGVVAKERILDVDSQNKRMAYTILSDKFEYHNAAFQVFAEANRQTRIIWTADVLPDEMKNYLSEMTDRAIEAIKGTLEGDFPRISCDNSDSVDSFRKTMVFESLGFSHALIASAPASDRVEKMMLYGQFIGSWDGTVIVHRPDGQRFENSCEVHFGWVLAGRAIQDVWLAPSRKTRAAGVEDGMYGTTLRVYNPNTDQWEITWIDPVRRNFNRMLGRPLGNEIVQEYRDEAGKICQWCFTNIRPDSFHWISRESKDGRMAWNLTAEFFLHRRRHEDTRRA
jgi:hypothetical protein